MRAVELIAALVVALILFVVLNILAWVMIQGAGQPDALVASVTQLGTVPCRITDACPAEGGGLHVVIS